MNAEGCVAGTRSAAGLFVMEHRGLLEVRGEDRVRWLDGMISGDVKALAPQGSGSGCYATLLTNRGAIVADLHVGCLGDVFLLESRGDQIAKIKQTLERFIIADDVTLSILSPEWAALGLEGPRATEILNSALGVNLCLGKEDWAEVHVDGREVRIAAFGFSGEEACQIYMAREDRPVIEGRIEAAGQALGLVRGDFAALEILRIEAGIPALGPELGEDVLPAEARLDHAISTSKGCYVGQEIVARLRARGQVNHLLVGLRIEGESLPEADVVLSVEGKRTGEITSSALSPSYRAIALGYVRREHSEVGTRVDFEGGIAQVTALPFYSQDSAGREEFSGAQPTTRP